FKILGLRDPFQVLKGSASKPCVLRHFVLKSSSFLALHLQAHGKPKIRGTCPRHMFISPLYSVFIPSEGLY
ncbi:Hypothetical predicted protein, partial [Marmota monax]